MEPNGKNVNRIEGRYAQFRIYDHTRTVAQGRAPGAGPATIPANPVGAVPTQMMRFHEKVLLDYEQLGNLSPVVGPNAVIDQGGADYITRQETTLAERLENAMEVMLAGMIRGTLYLKLSGDSIIPYMAAPSGNSLSISFNIPSGNLNQLNMLGGSNTIIDMPWTNQNAPIMKHIQGVEDGFAALTQMPLRHVLVTSIMWYNVISNIEVRTIGGLVQAPVETYTPVTHGDEKAGGYQTEFAATLRMYPGVVWHIMNHRLAIDGFPDPSYSTTYSALTQATLKYVIDTNMAVFLPEISKKWVVMEYGSEYVNENRAMVKGVRKQGLAIWTEPSTQPSGIEIISLLNALPVLMVPKAVATGICSGF